MTRIGVDLGGTTVKVGAVDERGKILSKVACPTNPERHYGEVIKDIARLCREAAEAAGCAWEEIERVGVGIPGMEDHKTGIVPFCTNLYWHHVPLRGTLSEMLGGVKVSVDNDAGVAALAEQVAGASQGTTNSVLITLGTGVGAGVILDGKLFSGVHGVATELGHLIVMIDGEECTCGNHGCWERYASATALIREGRKIVMNNPSSAILRAAGGDIQAITARTVIDCARTGDEEAMNLFRQYAKWVAIGLYNVVNTYDPEIILLGGGVSAAGEFLLEPVREVYKGMIFNKAMPYARLGLASLGNDAGIIGAAML